MRHKNKKREKDKKMRLVAVNVSVTESVFNSLHNVVLFVAYQDV